MGTQMAEKTRPEAFLTAKLARAELGSPQSRAAARAALRSPHRPPYFVIEFVRGAPREDGNPRCSGEVTVFGSASEQLLRWRAMPIGNSFAKPTNHATSSLDGSPELFPQYLHLSLSYCCFRQRNPRPCLRRFNDGLQSAPPVPDRPRQASGPICVPQLRAVCVIVRPEDCPRTDT
jgi:hypothetical protein